MRDILYSLLIIIILTTALTLPLVSSIREPVEGAKTVDIYGLCEIVRYDTRLQPFVTWTIDCPRADSIRIWPLPIVYPWMEDWWEKPQRKLDLSKTI
jgi:hypothetical protein